MVLSMDVLTNIDPLVAALIGLLLGVLLMRLYSRGHNPAQCDKANADQKKEIVSLQVQLAEQTEEMQNLKTQHAVISERLKQIDQLRAQLQQQSSESAELHRQWADANAENVELKTRLETERKNTAEKLDLLKQAESHLNIQFENLANKIFEDKSKQFTDHNKTSLNQIVDPLKEQLNEFKKRIETIYDNETKDRVSLREEIIHLKRDTAKMNQEALNLTRALKGDKKSQGNWGEMILEKVLEQSGLRKGREYETQGGYRDNDNRLLKPDVIIYLPEGKDVIVDSKVSLLDYEHYCSVDSEQEKVEALKRHINAVRNHIKLLSDKSYADLKGLRSLDFVLMFMPIESAFIAAFQADDNLFNDAFSKKIIVVTPTTLLATLRTIENIWRYERQNENARIIADKAGSIYDKIRGFVEDLEKLGKQISTVHHTYDSVMNKLTLGHGNLIRQANSFVELGVKVKRSLPKSLVDQAGNEQDNTNNS
jgi:DNA recombination protein RmuC